MCSETSRNLQRQTSKFLRWRSSAGAAVAILETMVSSGNSKSAAAFSEAHRRMGREQVGSLKAAFLQTIVYARWFNRYRRFDHILWTSNFSRCQKSRRPENRIKTEFIIELASLEVGEQSQY